MTFITGPCPLGDRCLTGYSLPASFPHPTVGGSTVGTVWLSFCFLGPAEAPASPLAWTFPLPNRRGPQTSRKPQLPRLTACFLAERMSFCKQKSLPILQATAGWQAYKLPVSAPQTACPPSPFFARGGGGRRGPRGVGVCYSSRGGNPWICSQSHGLGRLRGCPKCPLCVPTPEGGLLPSRRHPPPLAGS